MLSQGPAARAPSVRECGGLRRVGFLSPLHQQRVGGILDFLDLDLFVIHSHGGQSARHLLLQGWAQRSARQLCRGESLPKRPLGRDLPPSHIPLSQSQGDYGMGPMDPQLIFPAYTTRRDLHCNFMLNCSSSVDRPNLGPVQHKGKAEPGSTRSTEHRGRKPIQKSLTFTSSHRSFSSFSTRLVCSGVWGTCMDCCRGEQSSISQGCPIPTPYPSPHAHPTTPRCSP